MPLDAPVRTTSIAAALCLFALSCAGSRAAPAAPPSAPVAAAPPAVAAHAAGPRSVGAPSAPGRAISRSSIREAIAQGLGAFLQHVDLDEHPAIIDGKFRGFRIAGLHDAAYWAGIDLRPGDVVTSINGMPIERPEQAEAVFESLASAGELRISFDRDGQPKELVYAIVDGR